MSTYIPSFMKIEITNYFVVHLKLEFHVKIIESVKTINLCTKQKKDFRDIFSAIINVC